MLFSAIVPLSKVVNVLEMDSGVYGFNFHRKTFLFFLLFSYLGLVLVLRIFFISYLMLIFYTD